jgi:hypothetical protein
MKPISIPLGGGEIGVGAVMGGVGEMDSKIFTLSLLQAPAREGMKEFLPAS